MNQAEWEQVQSLFHRALEQPREERDAFIRAHGAGHEVVLEQVRAMLNEEERGNPLVEDNLPQLVDALIDSKANAHFLPREFGLYRTTRFLGEGGMGVVYLAEREDVGGQVAIKVLRDAWLSPARRERFLSEQRTLAHLNYASIAHLYDANVLPDGTPWFAMEYVQGVPITEYCAKHNCALRRRLQLFRMVCDAVQYAHQQAVIHRDLKPSNILVKDDGSIRLLDFGIAKQLDSLDLDARQTVTALRMMTPAYASPEQVRGEPASVQMDVYSLGVLLFELLTLELPFELKNLTPREAVTVLVEHEPPKPSSLATSKRDTANHTWMRASKQLWADLDVLCLTAMHKDPARRYRSVDALIRDVDHFLHNEPLDVRGDSLLYRTSTFVRRNRRGVALAAAVILFAAALIGFSAYRITKARDAALAEAARTERLQGFLMKLFEGGDAQAGPSDQLRVVSLVDRGIQEANALSATPKAQAELFQTLGSIEEKLGKLDKAEGLLQSALRMRTQLFGSESEEVAETLEALSHLRLDQARYDDAEKLARQAIEIDTKRLPPAHPARARAISLLGMVLEDQGKYDGAIQALQQAVDLQSGPDGVESDLSSSLTELANSQFYAGHLQISNELNHRVLSIDREIYGNNHPQVADDLINLGAIQFEWSHYKEAESFGRQALAIEQQFYGNDNPETASAMTILSRTLLIENKTTEALPMLRQALAIEEHVYGKVHPRVATTLNDLGHAALSAGNLKEAEDDFKRMADICRAVYHGKHYYIGIALANLSSVYMREKSYEKAVRALNQALQMYAVTLPPNHQNVGIARVRLGRALLDQKRYESAREQTSAGLAILRAQAKPQREWLQNAQADLKVEDAELGSAPVSDRRPAPARETTIADSNK